MKKESTMPEIDEFKDLIVSDKKTIAVELIIKKNVFFFCF